MLTCDNVGLINISKVRATFSNRCQARIDNPRWITFLPATAHLRSQACRIGVFPTIQPGIQFILPLKLALSGGHTRCLTVALLSPGTTVLLKMRVAVMGSPVRDRSGRERDQRPVEITQRLLWCAAVMVSLIIPVGLGFIAATSWKRAG